MPPLVYHAVFSRPFFLLRGRALSLHEVIACLNIGSDRGSRRRWMEGYHTLVCSLCMLGVASDHTLQRIFSSWWSEVCGMSERIISLEKAITREEGQPSMIAFRQVASARNAYQHGFQCGDSRPFRLRAMVILKTPVRAGLVASSI